MLAPILPAFSSTRRHALRLATVCSLDGLPAGWLTVAMVPRRCIANIQRQLGQRGGGGRSRSMSRRASRSRLHSASSTASMDGSAAAAAAAAAAASGGSGGGGGGGRGRGKAKKNQQPQLPQAGLSTRPALQRLRVRCCAAFVRWCVCVFLSIVRFVRAWFSHCSCGRWSVRMPRQNAAGTLIPLRCASLHCVAVMASSIAPLQVPGLIHFVYRSLVSG